MASVVSFKKFLSYLWFWSQWHFESSKTLQQARKLVRCDSYLQNLITLLTDSLTHPIRRVGYRIKKVPDNKTRYSEEKHKHDMSIIFSSDQFEGGLVGRM